MRRSCKKIIKTLLIVLIFGIAMMPKNTSAAAGDGLDFVIGDLWYEINELENDTDLRAELIETMEYGWDFLRPTIVDFLPPEYRSDTEYHKELVDIYVDAVIRASLALENYKLFSNANGSYPTRGIVEIGGQELPYLICDRSSNSCFARNDSLGEFKFQLVKVDESTVRVEYAVRNLSDVATDYSLDFDMADIDTYIVKTNNGFMFTCDDDSISVELSPNAVVTSNSFYSDGGGYSWQGWLEAGESKNFSATYKLSEPETFEANFYYLADNYTTPVTKTFIYGYDGNTPPDYWTDGPHHIWSTEPHGTNSVEIFNDKEHANYYEVIVDGQITHSWDGDITVSADDEYYWLELLADNVPKSEHHGQEYRYSGASDEEILALAGDNYRLAKSFFIAVAGIDEDYDSRYVDATVTIKMPLDFFKNKKDIKIVSAFPLSYDGTSIHPELEVLPVEVNSKTGEIAVDFKSAGIALGESRYDPFLYLYSIVYVPTLYIPEEPEDPYVPGVPNTGVHKTELGSTSATMIVLPTILISMIYAGCLIEYRKK